MTDVIIVGGGPAGSAAALLLARAGRRVVLFERAAFPRPKACGDCLSAGATGLLRDLGLLHRVADAGAARLADWRLRSPGGHGCRGGFDGASAFALERRLLDTLLLDAAREAGATVRRGRVRDLLRTPEGRVGGVAWNDGDGDTHRAVAPLVVGADGLRSVVARRAGLVRRLPKLRKVSLTTHGAGAAGRMDHGEMHVLEGACFGLAPAGNGRFNLTLVVEDARAADLRRLGPDAFFERWLDRAPAVRERVDDAVLERPFLASGPFDWPTRSPVAPGLALVGDAAGYYDPFTGQGVYQALEGGRRLAAAVRDVCLEDASDLEAALRRFARAHRRLKAPARVVQRIVEHALRGRRRADAVIRRLAAAPRVADALVAVTGDLRSPAALLSPRLISTFVFPPATEAS